MQAATSVLAGRPAATVQRRAAGAKVSLGRPSEQQCARQRACQLCSDATSQPPTQPGSPCLPPQPRTVVRAAAEEVKTASSNGAPVKGSATALEFDELTELIKWVDVAEAPACGPAGLHQ